MDCRYSRYRGRRRRDIIHAMQSVIAGMFMDGDDEEVTTKELCIVCKN